MGKMKQGIQFTGRIGRLCYYQSGNRTYVRIKSSLTRDRVLNEKEFEKTRKYAGDLGRASQIASPVYRALPADIKGRWIFRAIAGEAASLLYEGRPEQEVKDILWAKYIQDAVGTDKTTAIKSSINTRRSAKKINNQLKRVFLDRWQKQGKPEYYFIRAWKQGHPFNPETIPRRSEYFLGLKHAARLE